MKRITNSFVNIFTSKLMVIVATIGFVALIQKGRTNHIKIYKEPVKVNIVMPESWVFNNPLKINNSQKSIKANNRKPHKTEDSEDDYYAEFIFMYSLYE